ncbi:MAG: RsmD family RNA methyltransferase [Deltaproteobacteria bacterium]|nr:RsmD family RNA methyltransferase [Deltaproteobacteria bacterium]
MESEPEHGEPLQVTTGEMAYGPHAVARHDGKVLFVRGAAPHEALEVVVRESHERFAFAEVTRVLHASPLRRQPPCPLLPRCGGCPWQHLEYAAQLAAKQSIVREQLRRLAGLDVEVAPVLPSPREYGYRRRIKLRVDHGVVGFHAAASHTLVEVAHCLLAEPQVDAAIPSAVALAAALPGIRRIELSGGGAGGRVVAAGEVEGALRDADAARAQAWLAAHPGIAGLALRGRGWARAWGDVEVAADPEDGTALRVRAPGFTQVNTDANRLLVDAVIRAVAPRPQLRVLDLYAGAGNLSLPLRRRGALVTAVEQESRAAADARDNAARTPGPRLTVLTEPAEHAVARLAAAGERFDVVLLDPPRAGAAACLAGLLRLRAPRLVYVSCDPATLARDLKRLRAAYRIAHVQPIDLFPHTYHVETVVQATLSCDPPPPGVSSAPRHESTAPPRRRRS